MMNSPYSRLCLESILCFVFMCDYQCYYYLLKYFIFVNSLNCICSVCEQLSPRSCTKSQNHCTNSNKGHYTNRYNKKVAIWKSDCKEREVYSYYDGSGNCRAHHKNS